MQKTNYWEQAKFRRWQIPDLSILPVLLAYGRRSVIEAKGKLHPDGSIASDSESPSMPGFIIPIIPGVVVIAREPFKGTEPLRVSFEGAEFTPVHLEVYTPDGRLTTFVQWQKRNSRNGRIERRIRDWETREEKQSRLASHYLLGQIAPEKIPGRTKKARSYGPFGEREVRTVIDHMEEYQQAVDELFAAAWPELQREIVAVTTTKRVPGLPGEKSRSPYYTIKMHPECCFLRKWNVDPFAPMQQMLFWQAFTVDLIANGVGEPISGNLFGLSGAAVKKRLEQRDKQQYASPLQWVTFNGWIKSGFYAMGWRQIHALLPSELEKPEKWKKLSDDWGGKLHVSPEGARVSGIPKRCSGGEKLKAPDAFLVRAKKAKSAPLSLAIGEAYRQIEKPHCAIRWFRKAAQLGDAEGMFKFAEVCLAMSPPHKSALYEAGKALTNAAKADYHPAWQILDDLYSVCNKKRDSIIADQLRWRASSSKDHQLSDSLRTLLCYHRPLWHYLRNACAREGAFQFETVYCASSPLMRDHEKARQPMRNTILAVETFMKDVLARVETLATVQTGNKGKKKCLEHKRTIIRLIAELRELQEDSVGITPFQADQEMWRVHRASVYKRRKVKGVAGEEQQPPTAKDPWEQCHFLLEEAKKTAMALKELDRLGEKGSE